MRISIDQVVLFLLRDLFKCSFAFFNFECKEFLSTYVLCGSMVCWSPLWPEVWKCCCQEDPSVLFFCCSVARCFLSLSTYFWHIFRHRRTCRRMHYLLAWYHESIIEREYLLHSMLIMMIRVRKVHLEEDALFFYCKRSRRTTWYHAYMNKIFSLLEYVLYHIYLALYMTIILVHKKNSKFSRRNRSHRLMLVPLKGQ